MDITSLATSVDTGWTLLGAAMVFFMQAGFCMLESGLTRAKNAGNIIMKNLVDFAVGTPFYWFLGFGIMFGSAGLFIGKADLFSIHQTDFTTMIFQTVFCATSATIVSGAVAERTKFSSYCIFSCVISLIIYPISGHWIWGGGWLSVLGFHDFAGSTAVHMVGGVAALMGAIVVGPRIGKYKKDGSSNAILGHNLTSAALGVFILWFCWFGFNGCSTVGLSDGLSDTAARVFYTTNLATCTATLGALITTWIKYKKPDVSMTLNGTLAGLVAITAGCDTVTPVGAAIIGVISGVCIVFAVEIIDKKLKVDDPVGAVAVHGFCGMLGTILTGLFSYYDFGSGERIGLFYGGGAHFFLVQCLGVLTVALWSGCISFIVFKLLKHTIGIRCSAEEELDGLDLHEHGLTSAYADFTLSSSINNFGGHNEKVKDLLMAPENEKVPMDEAVPVQLKETKHIPGEPITAYDSKITKITILAKQNRFDDLKEALDAIDITGMTVTNVLGCGVQKGRTDYYRGVKMETILHPRIQVDIVVCTVPASLVIETARKVLYTGHIGDGKIFVYDVEQVIKVRTGEVGREALLDVDINKKQ